MKIKSLFDYMTPVADLPPEPMPTKVIRPAKKDGKIIYIAVERKKCL